MDDDPVRELVAVLERVVPGWLERCVVATADRQLGGCPDELRARARDLATRTGPDVVAEVAALVHADVDEQRGNPLALLRSAVRHPTELLADAHVPSVARDAFDVERFPDDRYGLVPATWGDVHPDLHEPGIRWGAWKAATVLARRREGST